MNPCTFALLAAALAFQGCRSAPESVDGQWSATILSGGAPVPFRFDLAVNPQGATGYFFDGERRIPSTSGRYENGKLHLHFDIYNADLDATLHGKTLDGVYTVHKAAKDYVRPVKATRPAAQQASSGTAPRLAGDWEIRAANGDKDVAWKLVLHQNGDELNGAILRIDGDTGALTGAVRNGSFVISHFSGARPALVEGTMKADGTLDLLLDRKQKLIGVREAEAASKGLIAEPDAFKTTTVQDPAAPFRFSASDLTGQTVSSDDPRFRDKVVLVAIGGSWCPNCMDEAPFLVDLYRKHHAEGLDIVGLNFESGDTAYDRKRVQSFVSRYAIPYPMLIAGTTEQVSQKLPQLVHFGAFPTTIYVGRDGRVKAIHDGFASVATGAEHEKLKKEADDLVTRLLAAKSA